MFRHTRSMVLFAAVVSAICGGAASAQEYPTKPITLIVPWPAGGSTDIAMRAIADSASKQLGQPIAIDNKGGGGGTVGPATMAAAAKSDGYTISQIPITVFRLPLMQDVSWDPGKDFSYIIPAPARWSARTRSSENAPRRRRRRRCDRSAARWRR
jgi:tripartite-type tricarboxylate transporter receptor subunit TctC